MTEDHARPVGLPVAPVERWLAPAQRFLHVESSSGVVLLACTVLALVAANTPIAGWFAALWKTPVELTFGGFRLAGDLGHLVVNDALMAIFFFVVGLEIKRELVVGELREPRKALFPVVAAFGGMVVPAAVYLAFQWGEPGQRGWAIPMATDIAFVVGFLALLGPRVPVSLKILLLALAIVDDLGAVLVIAIVFTEKLTWGWLGIAAAGFVLIRALNRAGVRRIGIYVVVGAFIWLATLQSGVHPTVAGVFLGLLTPAYAWVGDKALSAVVGDLGNRLRGEPADRAERTIDLQRLEFTAREALSPLSRLELALHPWVAFGVMPLFALANAGVTFDVGGVREPVAVAVAAGLALGKPVGILLFCWLAVKAGAARLPDGVGWGLLTGGACLAGIGFTMALFFNGLAFQAPEFAAKAAAGKVGILGGSLLSAILGAAIVAGCLRTESRHPAPAATP